jgi:hypothetical protein
VCDVRHMFRPILRVFKSVFGTLMELWIWISVRYGQSVLSKCRLGITFWAAILLAGAGSLRSTVKEW